MHTMNEQSWLHWCRWCSHCCRARPASACVLGTCCIPWCPAAAEYPTSCFFKQQHTGQTATHRERL